MSPKLEVSSAGRKIPTNPFLTQLVVNVLTAFAASLKGVDASRNLRFDIDGDDCRLYAADTPVELNPFVASVLRDQLLLLAKRLQSVQPTDPIRFSILVP